jgi:aminoglycoside phosphotransferase (APT) family kinase protein
MLLPLHRKKERSRMLSPPDAQLIAREEGMPGLATLLDDEAFVALLRTLCPAVEIESGQATYVRYKPQTSCLVAYRLQVDGEETLVYAIAPAERAQDKLTKAVQGCEIGSALGPGCLTVESLGLIIYGFPNDRELKALRKLADQATRQQLFERLLPESPQFWTGALIHLRYKPERRYVARLQAEDRQLLVKFYTEPDYVHAYAGAKAFPDDPALRKARLLGHSHRHQVQVQEWLPGQPLNEALWSAQERDAMIHAVARALATLHGKRRRKLIHYTPAGEVTAVQAADAAVAAIYPPGAERAQELAGRLTAQLEATSFTPCAIHNDFSADQVLWQADGQVALLDLDNLGMGDPMADLGTFVAQLKQDALRGLLPVAAANALTDKFVQAYAALVPHHWHAQRFHTHTAARLLRRAAEPFRQREANWIQAVEDTLHLAEEISDHAHACG